MSMVTTARCRLTQVFVRMGRRLHPAGKQLVESGQGALYDLGQILRDQQAKKPMVVFGAVEENIRQKVQDLLKQEDMKYIVWEGFSQRPTTADAERLNGEFLAQECDSFVVLGDGAAIDAVKIAAARCVSGGWTVMEMVGRRRLPRRKVPAVVAVPTVGGAGTESVATAVITGEKGDIFVIEGAALLPAAAILDAELLEDAGRDQVADGGLDGLCRAIEAYLAAPHSDSKTKSWAVQAAELLFESLEPCWNSGGTVRQRADVLTASRLGARAFSAVGGGYARAMIRAVQSVCALSFREACAIVLPMVLEKYGGAAVDTLAELAERTGVAQGGGRAERAQALIDRIRGMVFRMGLPEALEGVTAEQVEEIADLTAVSANPRSISPVVWTAEDCRDVVMSVCAREGHDME